MNDISLEELKTWMKAKRYTQKTLADMLGVSQGTVNRWLKSVHAISGPEQKLLAYLIRGELPFPVQRVEEGWNLDFTRDEFALIQFLARRDGFVSAEAWVTAKIRTYLAMTGAVGREVARVADDEKPYGQTSSS